MISFTAAQASASTAPAGPTLALTGKPATVPLAAAAGLVGLVLAARQVAVGSTFEVRRRPVSDRGVCTLVAGFAGSGREQVDSRRRDLLPGYLDSSPGTTRTGKGSSLT